MLHPEKPTADPNIDRVHEALSDAGGLTDRIQNLADALCGGRPRHGDETEPAPDGSIPILVSRADRVARAIAQAHARLGDIERAFGLAPDAAGVSAKSGRAL